jgi:hypothetical protein
MTLVAPYSARLTTTARAVRELAAVAVAMLAYFGLRVVVEGDRPTAVRNAERLLDLEATIGIDVERDVQGWVLGHDALRTVVSAAYVWLHWPLLVVAMTYLALRAPAVMARLRDALIASAAIGVVLFALVPMAPPRFMPGFVGTVSDDARRHYLPYPLDWTNQVAAFPSYHVGWTLITCVAVASVVRNWSARFAVLTPAAAVAVAVVGTGNHYVLDSVAGALLAVAAWWARGRVGRRHRSGLGGVGQRQDRDRPGVAVDPDHRPVGDPAGRTRRRHHARPAELARHDDRVAHLPADVDDDRFDRYEQRCP